MVAEKQLGIWMDHSTAHIMDITQEKGEEMIITTKHTHEERSHSSKGENLIHNKEQQKQSEFYKEIANSIKDYEDVIIFGPTDA